MTPTQRWTAAGAVVVSAATGIVTNLITDQWTWTLGLALTVLVLAGIALAVLPSTTGTTNGSRVEQIATRRGRITRSPIEAHGGDNIRQHADNATIEDSGIDTS